MRWQQAARWGVAVAGLGLAVLLYTQTRERPAGRPPPATPADPEVRAQSSAGTVVRFSDGEQTFELTHEGERVLVDGRIEWRMARVTIGDGTFLSADLISSSGESDGGEPAELHLRGHVVLDTPEGASVRADEATYNRAAGVAILPGAVTFTRGRVSGSGTNGEYYRDTGIFTLETDARIEMAGDEAGAAVHGSAQTMTFNRATAALLLDGEARIDHERQTMSADRATLFMTEDQERIRVIELRTGARVDPVAGHEADVPAMSARDIDLAFHDGTEQLERGVLVGGASMTLVESSGRRTIEADDIEFGTAPDGRTLTHLEAHRDVVVRTPAVGEGPARTIRARDLVATGQEGKGLTGAVFSGDVTFVESTPGEDGERTGSGNRLTMVLGGQLEAVERAHFAGNARFTDGDVTGDADLGDYDAAGGQLTLRPAESPSRLPRVESGSVTVDAATRIDVDLESRDLHAVGDVRTVSQGEGDAVDRTGTGAGFFTDDETMYGFGDEFWYVDETGEARYRGSADRPARVTQGETSVTAATIALRRETEDLDAETGVVATFVTAGEGEAEPATHRVESETLVYRSETSTATYTGDPVVMTGPDGETTADRMVMTLSSDSREVEQLDAEGDVHSTLVDGSVALTDSLVYEAAAGRYTLRGEPLVLRMVDKEKGSCSETRGRLAYYTVGEPSPEFPAAENRGRVVRRNVACDAPIER